MKTITNRLSKEIRPSKLSLTTTVLKER